MKELQKLGERIRIARTKAGFSQEQLAIKAGLPYQAIVKYEKDEGSITALHLLCIAQATGVTTDWLYGYDIKIELRSQQMPSVDNKASGLRIKKLREQSGLTQEDLGLLIGMTQQGISNIESGRKGTKIDTLVILAEHFHTTLDYIILGRYTIIIDEEVPINMMEKSTRIIRAVLQNFP